MLEDLSGEKLQTLVREILAKKNGTLDKDWSELLEQYGLDMSPETLRKAGVGIKMVDDARMLFTDAAEEMDEAYPGFIQRQKEREYRKQVYDVFRAEARSQLLQEEIAEAIRALDSRPVRLTDSDWNKYSDKERSVELAEKELVLALGDFHFGAEIKTEGLHGEYLNVYNEDVFRKRMTRLLDETRSICQKEGIGHVNVFMVGDLLDGMLRQSQLMRLQYGMVESTIRLSEYLAQWIGHMSEFADVTVYGCTGNHSEVRPLKAKAREYEDENLEKVIMWYLGARLNQYENIRIHTECNKFTFATILGKRFLLLHGDGEKSIERIARDSINLYGEPIDYFICGHLHRENDMPAGTTDSGNSVIVRVPSLCGMDRYAQSKGFGAKAGAIAMVIEKDYGRRCVYPIRLQ